MTQILGIEGMTLCVSIRLNREHSVPYGDFQQTLCLSSSSLLYIKGRRFQMELLMSSTLGTIFYTVVVFVAGALIGGPLWNWIDSKLPWNK